MTTYKSKYPIITVAVDLALFRQRPSDETAHDVLLIKRGEEPFKGRLALPGGHLDVKESPLECAVRETLEETGIDVNPHDLTFVRMLDKPGRDPRGRYISYLYTGVLEGAVDLSDPKGSDDAEWAGWMETSNAFINRGHMAFDHGDAYTDALNLLFRRTP